MKKQIIAITMASFATVAAHASTVTCTTNVNHDPRQASTDVSVSQENGQLVAKVVRRGGMAHFITAPEVIAVAAKRVGPEVVIYLNTDKAFQLEVTYQPIAGKVYGTLTEEIAGKSVETPVICNTAL